MTTKLVTQPEPRQIVRQTYTFAEFCELVGIGRSTAQELLKNGGLPVEPIRVGSRWVFPKVVVDRLLGLAQAEE